jgi:hypothetical protein
MLPLEYAIESGSPYSVIKFLQRASENNWKQHKEESMPGDTHTHIVQKLNHDQQLKQREHERNREKIRSNSLSQPEQDSQTQSKNTPSKSMFAKTA